MKENHYEDRSIHNFLKTLSIYQIDNDLGYTLAYNMLKNLSSGHITVRSGQIINEKTAKNRCKEINFQMKSLSKLVHLFQSYDATDTQTHRHRLQLKLNFCVKNKHLTVGLTPEHYFVFWN